MKRFLRLSAPAVLALCSLLLLVSVDARASGEGWYTSLREAEEVALREGKPILADFSTSWCGSCRNLERNTFPNPTVQARMGNFVKVRVDGDEHPDLVRSYGISGYPTLIAMSPGGKELNRTVGYVDASELTSDLDRAIRKHGPQVPKRESTAKAVRPAKSAEPERVTADSEAVAKPKTSSRPAPRQVAAVSDAPAVPKGGYDGDDDSHASSREPNREINYYTLSQEARVQSAPAKERALASASVRPIVSAAVSEAVDNSARETNNEPVSLQKDKMIRIADREPEPRSLAEAAPTKAATESTPETETVAPAKASPADEGAATPAPKEPEETRKAASKELPKPMLNISGRDTGFNQSGSSAASKAAPKTKPVTTKTAPVDADEAPAKAKTEAAKAEPESTGESTAAPAATGSVLGTIRKLADQTPEPGETSEEKVSKTESAKPEPKAAKSQPKPSKSEVTAEEPKAPSSRKVAEDKQADEPATEAKAGKSTSKKSDETAPARGTASDDTKSKSSDRTAQVPTSQDVSDWIRAAEGHQAAKRWKEARAMYARVVDRDPKNVNGQTDLAYIRMCALMVSPDLADNDKIRLDAYNKICEFTARFRNSAHMDYYTVTRADLAADLGKSDEARNLLADFPKQFPNSRYTSWARESWERLDKAPAAPKRKASSTKTTAKSKD
jgi:thiol-disulfide isomerase/thioredoxin